MWLWRHPPIPVCESFRMSFILPTIYQDSDTSLPLYPELDSLSAQCHNAGLLTANAMKDRYDPEKTQGGILDLPEVNAKVIASGSGISIGATPAIAALARRWSETVAHLPGFMWSHSPEALAAGWKYRRLPSLLDLHTGWTDLVRNMEVMEAYTTFLARSNNVYIEAAENAATVLTRLLFDFLAFHEAGHVCSGHVPYKCPQAGELMIEEAVDPAGAAALESDPLSLAAELMSDDLALEACAMYWVGSHSHQRPLVKLLERIKGDTVGRRISWLVLGLSGLSYILSLVQSKATKTHPSAACRLVNFLTRLDAIFTDDSQMLEGRTSLDLMGFVSHFEPLVEHGLIDAPPLVQGCREFAGLLDSKLEWREKLSGYGPFAGLTKHDQKQRLSLDKFRSQL